MKLVPIVFFLLFIGCQPSKPAEKATPAVKPDTLEVLSGESIAEEVPGALEQDRKSIGPCARKFATPVLKKSIYPGSTFVLKDSKREAIESINLSNGDKLEIFHKGCDYYVLSFRFETSRFQAEVTDLSYWIDKAVLLLFDVQGGLDTPLDIKGGINELKHLAEGSKVYNLGEEMIYDDHDMRGFVSIDRIEQLSETRYAIEISLAAGPL